MLPFIGHSLRREWTNGFQQLKIHTSYKLNEKQMQRSVWLSSCTELSCLLIHLPHASMYLKIIWVYKLVSRIHTHVQPRAILLVHYSQSGYPLGVSPVSQTSCCVIPSCSYSWTVLCAPQRDNSSAADKSLVALGYPESAPPRVLHSCLSLPTGAITAWK
jgi:hypothetical protein